MKNFKLGRSLLSCILAGSMFMGTTTSFADIFTEEEIAPINNFVEEVKAEIDEIADIIENKDGAAAEAKADAVADIVKEYFDNGDAKIDEITEEIKAEAGEIAAIVDSGDEVAAKEKVDAYIAFVKDALNLTAEQEEKIAEIVAEITAIVEKYEDVTLDDAKAEINAYIDELKAQAALEYAKLGHKPYNEDGDYVAIGGYTVYGTGLDLLSGEKTYAKLIDADSKSIYNPNGKLLPADAAALVEAKKADIEAAELITYQLDASTFIDAILSETAPDWNNYFDAETQAIIGEVWTQSLAVLAADWTVEGDAIYDEYTAKIKAAVMANLPDEINEVKVEADIDSAIAFCSTYIQAVLAHAETKKDEIVSNIPELDETTLGYAEKLAYAVVSYVADTKAAVEKIQEINPDATLVVVGMYNPAKGLKIDMNGTVIDAEAYAEYVIDATNLYYTALAAVNGGFAFVDVSDAETTGFGGEVVGVEAIPGMASNLYPSMHANQAGHEYIKEQIVASFACDYSVYESADETYHNVLCALCGDVKTKEYHAFVGSTCDKCGYEYIAPSYSYGGGGGSVNQFIIKFNTNGGSSVANVTIKKGELLEEPSAPTKEGFTFDGWYMDKALTNKYDFSEPVTKSFTLYAKWVEKVTDAAAIFTDVDKDAWYFDVVNQIVAKGLMVGLSETEFGPQATLTRGMFVTVLHRVEGTPAVEGELVFTDVAADQYYAEAVKWASANGIVSGITETEFAPNKEVTREQMAAILARYVEFKAIEVPEEGEATYTDADAISEYAQDAVLVAKKLGILVGNADGTFAPKSNATRAEAAALFVRLLGVMGE